MLVQLGLTDVGGAPVVVWLVGQLAATPVDSGLVVVWAVKIDKTGSTKVAELRDRVTKVVRVCRDSEMQATVPVL